MANEKTVSCIERLQAPLRDEEIEFRIGTVKEGSGFSILAYKTARTDTRRLNEVFGTKWKNEFFYDDNKNLCCKISVYDTEISQWVSRENVGTESKTEKEKGSYSDAMKRAGFSWGIGLELYDYPFMWVQCKDWKTINGKKYPNVRVQEWIKKGDLIIDKAGTVMFNLNSKNSLKSEIKGPQKTESSKQKPYFNLPDFEKSTETINSYLNEGKTLKDILEMIKQKYRVSKSMEMKILEFKQS